MKAGIDTNILIYAVSPRDPVKHAIALRIMDQAGQPGRGILTLQALTEFYAVATRKAYTSAAGAMCYVQIWSDVFPVTPGDAIDFSTAMHLHRDHHIPFWDAMLIATYQRAGASVLVTEDFQDGRLFGTLRVVNPFAADAGPMTGLLGLHEDAPSWRTTQRP